MTLNNWIVIPECKGAYSIQIPIISQNLQNKETDGDILMKHARNEMSDDNVKEFTEKDFEPSTFLNEECLFRFPLPTYQIGTTLMEYEWSIEGKYNIDI